MLHVPKTVSLPEDEVTIVATDSGLGGLSVVADLERKLQSARIFKKAHLVFFNALFSNESGYTQISFRDEKIRIFNNTLFSIEDNYSPDLLLIACNTLSTIYGDTDFAGKTGTPVVGIVEAGVEIIDAQLRKVPDAKVVIFSTETTISEDNHRRALIAAGISPESIITQNCLNLAHHIDRTFDSKKTAERISIFVDEALAKLPSLDSPIAASLNCTHFGYCLGLWQKAFEKRGVKPIAFLNPNYVMTDFLFQPEKMNRFEKTDISVEVVSKIEIIHEREDAFNRFIESISPKTAEALVNYKIIENLFQWP